MAGWLDYGAGAASGLEALLERKLKEQIAAQGQQRIDEEVRSNKSTEGYRDRALTESSALRRDTAAGLAQTRADQEANRKRDDLRARIQLRPIGSKVQAGEYDEERNVGGIPDALYKREARGPEGDEYGPQQDITYGGSQAQLSTEERIKNAEENAKRADADRDEARKLLDESRKANLNLGNRREKRLTDWGPPTITIGDPDAAGGSSVIRRDQLPKDGAPAAPPGTVRTQGISNDVGLAQLDRLEEMFKGGAGDMVGPGEGRLRGFGQKIPGVPVNEKFSDFEAATSSFRNAVIKAITGAQMSEPEANRIRQQIPEITDKKEVWLAKARQTRKNLQDLDTQMRGGKSKGKAEDAVPSDPYTEYLKRQKK